MVDAPGSLALGFGSQVGARVHLYGQDKVKLPRGRFAERDRHAGMRPHGAAGHRCLPRRKPRARNRSSPWCKTRAAAEERRVCRSNPRWLTSVRVCGDAVWPCRRLPTCRPQVFEEGASASSLQRPNWIAAADAATHADGCHTLPARRHGRRAQRARPRGHCTMRDSNCDARDSAFASS